MESNIRQENTWREKQPETGRKGEKEKRRSRRGEERNNATLHGTKWKSKPSTDEDSFKHF